MSVRAFWARFVFDSVNSVKQLWVRGIRSFEGLNRILKREEIHPHFFLASQLELGHLVLIFSCPQTGTDSTCSPRTAAGVVQVQAQRACRWQIEGLLRLPTRRSQLLIINPSLSVCLSVSPTLSLYTETHTYIFYWFRFSGEL